MGRRGTLLVFARAHATLDQLLVPAGFEVTQEAGGWSSVYPQGRDALVCFHARLVFRKAGNPGRAVFVCVGPPAVLQRLADAIAADGLAWTYTWPDLPALRADAQATAVAIRAAWPDDRPHAWGGTPSAPIDLGPIGPLVALRAAMAGYNEDDAEV